MLQPQYPTYLLRLDRLGVACYGAAEITHEDRAANYIGNGAGIISTYLQQLSQ